MVQIKCQRWRHLKQLYRWRGDSLLALRFDKARLKVDNVIAKLVVLRLNQLVGFLHLVCFADLLLELFDVTLFTLAECALRIKQKKEGKIAG